MGERGEGDWEGCDGCDTKLSFLLSAKTKLRVLFLD